jgi:hypothetical protein
VTCDTLLDPSLAYVRDERPQHLVARHKVAISDRRQAGRKSSPTVRTDNALQRLYRATVSEHSVLGSQDRRMPVSV